MQCLSCARATLGGAGLCPKAIYLETEAEAVKLVDDIFWQAAASHAMPPGNVIWMEDEERALLAAWRALIQSDKMKGS